MPEGDTIFRTARALGRALIDQPITGFRSMLPKVMRVHEEQTLIGQCVTRVDSHGKWLEMHFSGGAVLLTHMLMSGSWHIYRPGERWQKPAHQMRIVLETARFHAIAFRVPVAEMHTADSLARHRRIPRGEIDLLAPEFDAAAAAARIAQRTREEIADVLLHQEVVAGVGNEFKSEICFVCGVNPFTRVGQMSAEEIARVVTVSQQLLQANVMEDAGDTVMTYRGWHRRTTRSSEPAERVWVYGRAGEPCRRCGGTIAQRKQGPDARITFWCPQCQPLAG